MVVHQVTGTVHSTLIWVARCCWGVYECVRMCAYICMYVCKFTAGGYSKGYSKDLLCTLKKPYITWL